jgi:protein-disulfide isomerase
MIQMSNQALTQNTPTLELIEYGDFSCRLCQEFQKVLTTLLPLFAGELVYTFRHFPDRVYPPALLMATVAEAARKQDQYGSMHQALFTQALLLPFSVHSALKLAIQLGMDEEMFLDDLHDETLKQRIWSDIEQGHAAGVVATPTLFLGTRHLHGRLTQARLAPLIRHYVDQSVAQVAGTLDQKSGQVHRSLTGHH